MADYQRLVDEVSALLRAPVTLEDREFALIAFSSHEDEADPVRTRSILHRRSSAQVRAWFEGFGIARAAGPVRTPADPGTGVRARLCLPARHAGGTYGYLWVLDDGAVEPADPRVARAMALAARAGELLAADAWLGEAAPRAFARLLSASAGERADGARMLTDLRHPVASAPVAAVLVTPAPGPARVPHGVLAHRVRNGMALLVPLPDPDDTAPARAAATRLLGSREPLAGVGGGRAELQEAVESWREARLAVRAARVEPRFAPVACWDDLGALRMVGVLPAAAPGAPADPVLRPLLAKPHADLLRTAEAYLEHAGQVQPAAAALSVHRQTLYYRLSRIEALTGLDLGSGEDRLLLHLAVRAFRLAAVPDLTS
ncbi:PucR family transcriptional regulator [Actinomadura craniellae]|uniref:PucR family transcriptional regulator n=1 Tax=Actinomadura craniellae TaxID=2231787 RepID=A0A365H1A8_9ACTN|nr:helix-turn-helix domain-containing protein [Actinomadura craniellae]RAY12819.1 PucR family transcriptional regulator [Actinomadura craniellae]